MQASLEYFPFLAALRLGEALTLARLRAVLRPGMLLAWAAQLSGTDDAGLRALVARFAPDVQACLRAEAARQTESDAARILRTMFNEAGSGAGSAL